MAAFGIGIAIGLLLLAVGFVLLLLLGAVSMLFGPAGVAVALLAVPVAAAVVDAKHTRQRAREDEALVHLARRTAAKGPTDAR